MEPAEKGIRDRELRFIKNPFVQKTRFAIAKMAKNACFACVTRALCVLRVLRAVRALRALRALRAFSGLQLFSPSSMFLSRVCKSSFKW